MLFLLQHASCKAEWRVATPTIDVEYLVTEGVDVDLISKLRWKLEQVRGGSSLVHGVLEVALTKLVLLSLFKGAIRAPL